MKPCSTKWLKTLQWTSSATPWKHKHFEDINLDCWTSVSKQYIYLKLSIQLKLKVQISYYEHNNKHCKLQVKSLISLQTNTFILSVTNNWSNLLLVLLVDFTKSVIWILSICPQRQMLKAYLYLCIPKTIFVISECILYHYPVCRPNIGIVRLYAVTFL